MYRVSMFSNLSEPEVIILFFLSVLIPSDGPCLVAVTSALSLIWQRLEEETLDQNSLGPPSWRLMHQATSCLLCTKF